MTIPAPARQFDCDQQCKYYLTLRQDETQLKRHSDGGIPLKVMSLENGPFLVNSYLIINEDARSSFIIDPGSNVEPLLDHIRSGNLSLEAIIATHGHIDHVAGVNAVKARNEAPFYINALEEQMLASIPVQARMFGVSDPGKIIIDKALPESGDCKVAGITVSILHTPGHSPGSLSFYFDGIVFCGDSLFNFSIGRTDLPGGNYGQLISSIEERLFTLPDETRVLTGHGPETTIGKEKQMNPFF
jgi:hydroxyacylglutathione hydrolase